mmetsp:Transcript_1594/g.4176  ORF Transcript_1594/g.4176 Transcript_1594/m.4176 type:complete len:106 (-) Transcript_1594:83-400(-)
MLHSRACSSGRVSSSPPPPRVLVLVVLVLLLQDKGSNRMQGTSATEHDSKRTERKSSFSSVSFVLSTLNYCAQLLVILVVTYGDSRHPLTPSTIKSIGKFVLDIE